MGFFFKGLKNDFEPAVVNEPSVFEPLKFYCIFFYTYFETLSEPFDYIWLDLLLSQYHVAAAADRRSWSQTNFVSYLC